MYVLYFVKCNYMNLNSCVLLFYTRRPRLPPFILQPLCGSGVTSSILPMRMPTLDNVRMAACAPGPGFLAPLWPPCARTRMYNPVMPFSRQISATFFAAPIAAVGELSRRSDFTIWPPDDRAIVSVPVISVIVIIVLL